MKSATHSRYTVLNPNTYLNCAILCNKTEQAVVLKTIIYFRILCRPKLKNPKKFVLDFVGHMPVVKLKGAYNLTGNVISLPVRMNGLIDFVLGKYLVLFYFFPPQTFFWVHTK